MSDPGTTAPQQHYPSIVPAPRSDSRPWVADDRNTIAPDQAYPEIVPAEPVVDVVCPECGK